MKTAQKGSQVKVGLLEVAKQWGKVSPAWKVRGYRRDRCERFTEREDAGGEAAWPELRRRKPNRQTRGAPEVEEAVCGIALEQPAWGQGRAAKEFATRGMLLAPAGVRWVWGRKGWENLNNRGRAREAKVARESHLLTVAPLATCEKAQVDNEAHGEFASACPGSCGAQDPCSVGTLKGAALRNPASLPLVRGPVRNSLTTSPR